MLLEIHIQQFALIEEATVELTAGLNVLTGETGAGKSIVIDAVNFLLGGRTSSSLVRTGATKARVEGRFDLAGADDARALLSEWELQDDDPDTLVVVRELTSSGKNGVRLNGRLGTLAQLSQLGDALVDIHGQHEHQLLMRTVEHLHLLDRLLGDDAILAEVRGGWEERRRLQAELDTLQGLERERARQEDWLRHEVEEIERAGLRPGEQAELEQEKDLLAHAEKIRLRLGEAWDALDGEEPSAAGLVGRALKAIEGLAAYSDRFNTTAETLRTVSLELSEATHEVRDALEEVNPDPERLDEVQARLALMASLQRKYGDSIEAVLAYADTSRQRLTELEGNQARMETLTSELQQAETRWREAAGRLSQARQKLARTLEQSIGSELAALSMERTRFVVDFHEFAGSADGLDRVEFMISPNPGEPLRPLSKTASGGELSRLMLALKTIFASVDRIPTVIFDEVDTGIGGQAAGAVAERLRNIAGSRQVVCITHLPVIAAAAHTHWHLSKEVEEERTRTLATHIEGKARQREIARMLSGQAETAASLKHAQELLLARR
ncbi:MAG TPA: DNA repair protein RecN [Candidatus Xenobia bacterium]